MNSISRVALGAAFLSVLLAPPLEGQEPDGNHSARESVVFSGGAGYWDVSTGGMLARAAMAYEYRLPDGLGFYAEVGLGFRSSWLTWVLVPGVSVYLEPQEPSSVFLLGGLSVLDGGFWGFNAGAGYAMRTYGDGFRFYGRVHVLGTASALAQSVLVEAMVAYSIP
jgi:hypothetical protein